MEALSYARHGTQSRRSLLAILLQSLPLLLCILAVQIRCSTSQESSAVPESGAIPCSDSSDCTVGYHCSDTYGVCIRRSCQRDCSDATGGPMCGRMNGIVSTYSNRCELKKSECEANEEILIVRNGPCETLPPPRVHTCEEQKKYFIAYWNENPYLYVPKCIVNASNDIESLKNCSSPKCNPSGYALRQCSSVNDWCWCSTREGDVIEETLMQDMPDNFCSLRVGCGNHRDGEVFTPASGCGICECLNGVVSCFEDYVPNSRGKLNASQVALLKDELVQIFFFQYNQNKHVIIDIRRFHQNPQDISDTQKDRALEWKFSHYDMGGDGELTQAEEHRFLLELYDYVNCKAFFDHITDVIDADGNGRISAEEWYLFFDMEHTSADLASSSASGTHTLESQQQQQQRSRRHVLKQRPIHSRKKFQYLLH